MNSKGAELLNERIIADLTGRRKSVNVYCRLVRKTDDYALYSIGTVVTDMTGEIIFYKDLRDPELIKQAEVYPVRIKHIASIYIKYKESFSQGVFKEKLAHEIG